MLGLEFKVVEGPGGEVGDKDPITLDSPLVMAVRYGIWIAVFSAKFSPLTNHETNMWFSEEFEISPPLNLTYMAINGFLLVLLIPNESKETQGFKS